MSGTFFDRSSVLAGIHLAMEFGQPNTATDRATFYMPRTVTASGNLDQDDVPMNPNNLRNFSSLVKKTVKCAVEYFGAQGKDTNLGVMVPDKVKLTLLDPEFDQIEGFEYVVISGSKYLYWKSEPVLGLGAIDVHQIWCKAEDVL